MINFSAWESYPYRTYNGANGNKRCVKHDGRLYMVKFFNPHDAALHAAGAISEHISCSICNDIGLEAQKTRLGYFFVNGETWLAVACEDFCGKDERFYEFSAVKNWVVQSSHEGSGNDLNAILLAIESQQLVPPQKLKEWFWDTFIFDTLIGNFDRHAGNFGIIVNEEAKQCRIAPVYDCGSSLFPAAAENEELMRRYLKDEREQDARIYEYPRSIFRNADGEKIRYFDFIADGKNPDCTDALLRIAPKIRLDRIHEFIRHLHGLSPLQKEFYCKVLSSRKEKIIDYCYEKLVKQDVLDSYAAKNPLEGILKREAFLQNTSSALDGAEARYAALFRQYSPAAQYESTEKHILDSNIDVRIAVTMLKEKMYERKEIAKALFHLSPKGQGSQEYVNKIMLRAKGLIAQQGFSR